MSSEYLKQILRVAGFCFTQKSDEVLRSVDAWVLYTGDGFSPLEFLLRKNQELFRGNAQSPALFVTGPDNLLLAKEEDKQLNAENFAQRLREAGVSGPIISDSSLESQYTHGQALSLVRVAREEGWTRVALFTSWYHELRAWLTTLTRLPQEMDLLIIPVPSYGLAFNEANPELEGSPSSWELFNKNTLARISEYQDKGFCASFDVADKYLRHHGF